LLRHRVESVLIGGLAATAQGAGWATYDADIVVDETAANLARLLSALVELDAAYDTFHQPPIRPRLELLSSATGPQLFRTRFGRLDVLKEAGGETFATLIADAVEAEQFGHRLRCASIDALLRMKRAANRPKDQAGIAQLEAARRARDPKH
jgi:hypothetical protein